MESIVPPPTVCQIADFLRARLGVTDSVPLVWRAPPEKAGNAEQHLRRIGLALDENHHFDEVDALFLHRPFRLAPETLPRAVVFAVHKGFDDHLTVGFNPALAQTLALRNIEPLFRKGAVIGMVGGIAPAPWEKVQARLLAEFGGAEQILLNGAAEMGCVAFVGAMTPELIAQAADLGATVYVTGQFRQGAQAAAHARNVSVVAVGHRKAELWGLRQLARELAVAFPGLEAVRVFTDPRPETGINGV